MLLNTGRELVQSRHGLLSTLAFRVRVEQKYKLLLIGGALETVTCDLLCMVVCMIANQPQS